MSRHLDPRAKIRPEPVAHFVLRVRDIKRAVAWYEDVLGMEMVHDAGDVVRISIDGIGEIENSVIAEPKHTVRLG